MTSAVESFEPSGGSVLFDDRVFTGFFVLVSVLMVAMMALFVWLLVRNVRTMRSVGPGAAVGGSRPGPRPSARLAPSLAQRLQELDDLHRRGVITDGEHTTARHQALTSP